MLGKNLLGQKEELIDKENKKEKKEGYQKRKQGLGKYRPENSP
jgi:hypothetical protein